MKKFLSTTVIALATSISFAQNSIVTIQDIYAAIYDGPVAQADLNTHDFSGEQIDLRFTDEMANAFIEIQFSNETGSDVEWKVSRRRINTVPSWQDYLVYGDPSTQFEIGMAPATMDTVLWIAPSNQSAQFTIGSPGAIEVEPHFDADPTIGGCSVYRYYVGTNADPFLDSVDISLCFTLGTEEVVSNELEVFPNPANDEITINADLTESKVQLVDALGQTVFTSLSLEQNTLNVSELKNGIYFLIVEKEGKMPIQKKILIQH